MEKNNYHPEPYWTEVADRIKQRADKNVIAGDDEPYYRYKRERFLEMLSSVDFKGKKVLEVGHGPGGNLHEVSQQAPLELHGVDISAAMIELATKNLAGKNVTLHKINGTTIPFEADYFDIVFTATVLQHNTDEAMLAKIIGEICRVSKDKVYIFERVDKTIQGDELCLGRPVAYYQKFFGEHGFEVGEVDFINIHASYLVCGAIRKGLNPKARQEGEPLNAVSMFLENLLLPLTKRIDKIMPKERDLAKITFSKKQ